MRTYMYRDRQHTYIVTCLTMGLILVVNPEYVMQVSLHNKHNMCLTPFDCCLCLPRQAIIEGLGITLSKMTSPPPPSMPFPQPGMPGGPPVGAEGMAGLPPPPPISGDAAAAPAAAAGGSEAGSSSGWWSWLTGGEEQKVGAGNFT